MTVSSLPPQPAIVAPVTAANKTEPAQVDSGQEPGSFQQVLSSQINKDAAEAAPATQVKGKTKAAQADDAPAVKSSTAEQPEVTTEQAAELADAMLKAAAGVAKAEPEAKPMHTADEKETATEQGENMLPVSLLPDQIVQQPVALPGLANLTKAEAVAPDQSHLTEGATGIHAMAAAPIAGAAKPSLQPVPNQATQSQTPAPTALSVTAEPKSAPQQQAELPVAATNAAKTAQLSAAKEEGASSPDFAKLLAARESQPQVAAYQTQTMAPLNAGQVATTANLSSIEQPLGSKGWDQAVSQKVVWMVGAKEQSATLTLNPPDLGPLQVVIHVHNDQADTTFISQNPEVRQALENSISTLRNMMSDSGIQLGDANISANSQSQQGFQQAEKERGAAGSRTVNAQVREEVVSAAAVRSYSRAGLVDTFA